MVRRNERVAVCVLARVFGAGEERTRDEVGTRFRRRVVHRNRAGTRANRVLLSANIWTASSQDAGVKRVSARHSAHADDITCVNDSDENTRNVTIQIGYLMHLKRSDATVCAYIRPQVREENLVVRNKDFRVHVLSRQKKKTTQYNVLWIVLILHSYTYYNTRHCSKIFRLK